MNIDFIYRSYPYEFTLLDSKYLFSNYENTSSILQYYFDNNYININNPKFQKYMADSICNLNPHNPFDFNLVSPGIHTINDLKVFYFVIKYVLSKEIIKNYLTKSNETLLHQISKLPIILSKIMVNKFFDIFDNANFDYTTPKSTCLLFDFFDNNNIYAIMELIKRSNFNLNDDKIFETIKNYIFFHINNLKYKCDTSNNPIYKEVYYSNFLIKLVFSTNCDTPEFNYNLMNHLYQICSDYNNYHFETMEMRNKLVKPLDKLENYYDLIKLFISKGLDLTKRINGKTLLDYYNEGSYPILVLYKEMNIKFIKLLNKKIDL